MTSFLTPLKTISQSIQDPHLRQTFDAATQCDAKLTVQEIDDVFSAAGEITNRDLADLEQIRERGHYLFKSNAARSHFDAKLDALSSRVRIALGTNDDTTLNVQALAVDKLSISGLSSGRNSQGAASTITVSVKGKTYSVSPRAGESARDIAFRLSQKIEADGQPALFTNGDPSVLTIRSKKFMPLAAVPVFGGVDSVATASPVFENGDVGTVSGTVKNYKAGGEAPPSGGAMAWGSWLVLDEPIEVGGKEYSEIQLGGMDIEQGMQAELTGTFEVREGWFEVLPPPTYVALVDIAEP